jgi:hypothetical protein
MAQRRPPGQALDHETAARYDALQLHVAPQLQPSPHWQPERRSVFAG